MRNKFYTTSTKAWAGMIEALNGAQRSIYLEMYAFVDNTVGYDFFEILKRKAKAGLRVKVIVDSVGSSDLKPQTIQAVRAAGVELLVFSYWLRRTHKKILVVDDQVAFVGGVNIHKLFKKWNDLQMRLTGPIVKGITHSFIKTYALCGGRDPQLLLRRRKTNLLSKTKLWLLERWQSNDKVSLKQYYQRSIQRAQTSITLVTPYFAPHRWLTGALHQAVIRGVVVHVILPEETDLWIMRRVNYFYVTRLQQLGIQFYLSKQMNHAKAMLVDNQEGLVGSNNIDPLSFHYNIETGVFFRETAMVKELAAIMTTWKTQATLFNPSLRKPRWFDYVLAPVIRIFQSII